MQMSDSQNLNDEDTVQSLPSHEWRWYYTGVLYFGRICMEVFSKSLSVFAYALSLKLNISVSEFSIIIICGYIGSIFLTPFFGKLNEKYLTNSFKIFVFYSFFCGIGILLFSLPFDSNFINNKLLSHRIAKIVYL